MSLTPEGTRYRIVPSPSRPATSEYPPMLPAKLRLAYTGRDSIYYGIDSVKPESSKCPPDTCILSFESLPLHKNKRRSGCIIHCVFYWYTGRDSNPQPSEPESDALSIEPPVHLLYSLNIIAVFSGFVKRDWKNIFRHFRVLPGESGCFPGFCVV